MKANASLKPQTTRRNATTRLLRGSAVVLALVALFTAFAPAALSGSASANGSLAVSLTIRPSILVSVHSNGGLELTGNGTSEASVTLPIQVSASSDDNGDVVSEIPISVQSRVANAGATHGYSLSATLIGRPGWVLEIDGNRVDTASAADVTMAKAIGDPYGTPTCHVIRVVRPKGDSGPAGSGYLVLKASPKPM